jgi:hypothetical protein
MDLPVSLLLLLSLPVLRHRCTRVPFPIGRLVHIRLVRLLRVVVVVIVLVHLGEVCPSLYSGCIYVYLVIVEVVVGVKDRV